MIVSAMLSPRHVITNFNKIYHLTSRISPGRWQSQVLAQILWDLSAFKPGHGVISLKKKKKQLVDLQHKHKLDGCLRFISRFWFYLLTLILLGLRTWTTGSWSGDSGLGGIREESCPGLIRVVSGLVRVMSRLEKSQVRIWEEPYPVLRESNPSLTRVMSGLEKIHVLV